MYMFSYPHVFTNHVAPLGTIQSSEMEGEVVKSRFKRVCVFCGSSTGKRDCYRDAAIDLAQELVLL